MNTAKFHNRSLSYSKLKSTNRIINGQFSEPNQLSSSILQQTHEQHSFPKAKRFPSVSRESTPKMLLLSDTKTKRSTSFGFGTKLIKPLDLERRDRLNPAPGDYQVKVLQSTKSFSFGNKLAKIDRQEVPGPGQYQFKLLSKTPQFSIYGKIIEKQVLPKQQASFVTYNPKEALTLNQRFNKISFGIGERPKQTFNEQIPGPGSYQCKSLFDLICERRNQKGSP
ncbi:unnamed protein product (macronuclear) [Paramecium tetraurelia]|uniref:Uncharacterized protein n=1 Tax=Paramecium tetraurelia TaxID=5888 RepID=A0DR13_PARTE|nr:uncharacterized protein GSPATT00002881001 [Paramecium tetraurelia]CAK85480.1 unnamed protein product [Paramecium tetraurelia]|eukprot:XP_001452877.1 hypothetical protein (macronuclear) [Paramecium tetraurelia strain d4-2]